MGAGTLLSISIDCHMDRSRFLSGTIDSCDYHVRQVENSQAKTFTYSGLDPMSAHGVQERHGIKIKVITSGHMGRVKFSAFLLAWVSAAALFGVVNFGVDMLLRYVMPLRDVYRILKWE